MFTNSTTVSFKKCFWKTLVEKKMGVRCVNTASARSLIVLKPLKDVK